jgi:hypothetical protein
MEKVPPKNIGSGHTFARYTVEYNGEGFLLSINHFTFSRAALLNALAGGSPVVLIRFLRALRLDFIEQEHTAAGAAQAGRASAVVDISREV